MVTDLVEVFRIGTAKAKENIAFRRYLSAHHYDDKTFQILATEVQQQVDCTACASHLQTTPEEVVRLYTVRDPDAPASRLLRNSRNGCVFLDGNLCAIYEARPKTCRDFPHVSVGTHSLGSRQASLARWAALCPIIFNALETYKHRVGYHPHAA